jgi:hypothetical protein
MSTGRYALAIVVFALLAPTRGWPWAHKPATLFAIHPSGDVIAEGLERLGRVSGIPMWHAPWSTILNSLAVDAAGNVLAAAGGARPERAQPL